MLVPLMEAGALEPAKRLAPTPESLVVRQTERQGYIVENVQVELSCGLHALTGVPPQARPTDYYQFERFEHSKARQLE